MFSASIRPPCGAGASSTGFKEAEFDYTTIEEDFLFYLTNDALY